MKTNITLLFFLSIMCLHNPTNAALTKTITHLAPKIGCGCAQASMLKTPFSCAQFARHGIYLPCSNPTIMPPSKAYQLAQKALTFRPSNLTIAKATATSVCAYALYQQYQDFLFHNQLPENDPLKRFDPNFKRSKYQYIEDIPTGFNNQNNQQTTPSKYKPRYGYKPDSLMRPNNSNLSTQSTNSAEGIRPYIPKKSTPRVPQRRTQK